VVVDVALALVLVLRVLVALMDVLDPGMVVLVVMSCHQVRPLLPVRQVMD
jgi:hypothetical protein